MKLGEKYTWEELDMMTIHVYPLTRWHADSTVDVDHVNILGKDGRLYEIKRDAEKGEITFVRELDETDFLRYGVRVNDELIRKYNIKIKEEKKPKTKKLKNKK